ncbi:hypothetical protein [Nakamurella aerolata]|uniref:Aminoglycoside phosphotransferase domain-containing protein n=1 Tax=Nakamurella aerolata TaxID=1656892 RepID=A0A849A777_9ACTN|nr:hypothetical protein [Nakamurella aerolata]NNG35887.1 hypothetical protein [Nakamurella aerolata]
MTALHSASRWVSQLNWAPDLATYDALAEQPDDLLVARAASGYLEYEVLLRPSWVDANRRFRWMFAPGSERTSPLNTVPAALAPLLTDQRRLSDARWSLAAGNPAAPWQLHFAPGRATVEMHIRRLHHTNPGESAAVFGAAAALGQALRSLGAITAEAPEAAAQLDAPRPLRRLDHWLRTGDGPWGATMLHDRMVQVLGPARLREVGEWINDVPAERIVHGRAGLHTVVVPETTARPAVLLGDEIAYGPKAYDLGWVLGQILVQQLLLSSEPATATGEQQNELYVRARDHFLTAYGASENPELAGRWTIARILLEIHDAAAFRDEQLHQLLDVVAELYDVAR